MARKKKIQGLGDVVATVTKFVGIEPCQACKERQAKWNTLFPTRLKPRELTETELKQWSDFHKQNPTLSLKNDQRKLLCRLYADVFQVPYYEPCVSCSPKPYMVMIERLDAIYNTYE